MKSNAKLQWLAATIWLLGAAPAAPADAPQVPDQLQTRFAIDDADPESHVPTPAEAAKSPLEMGYWVMLVSERAEAAQKSGDHELAVKYFRALAKAAPDRAVAFTRTCLAYERMGDLGSALQMCRQALDKEGVTVEDHAHYVRLLVARAESPTAAEVSEADALIAHVALQVQETVAEGVTPEDAARARTAGLVAVEEMRCVLGMRLQDVERVGKCVSALALLAPEHPKTLALQFSHALMAKDFERAEKLIAAARARGIADSGITLMQAKLGKELELRPWWERARGDVDRLAMPGAFLLVLLALTTVMLRRGRGPVESSTDLVA